jgi:hypothetical protein
MEPQSRNPECLRDFGITEKFSVVSKRMHYDLGLMKSCILHTSQVTKSFSTAVSIFYG